MKRIQTLMSRAAVQSVRRKRRIENNNF